MAAHDKPILTTTPQDFSGFAIAPYFNPANFQQAITNHGYDVWLEKAVICPCRDKANGHHDTSCKNCGASGWIFVNKTETRAVVQHFNQQTKYQQWTEANMGTVNVTTSSVDHVGFMDRLTVLDVVTSYSQVVHARLSSTGKLFGFLAYQPTEIELAYIFATPDSALIPLASTDYQIVGNRFQLADAFLTSLVGITDDNLKYLNVTLRYFHTPVYHIIDVNREVIKNRSKDCSTGIKTLKELPISSVAKKPHLLYEMPDFSGDGLFDNTVYQ